MISGDGGPKALGDVAAKATAPWHGGSDVLSALDGLGGGPAEGVVCGDDHEGEDALGDDVHDGIGHNLVRVCRPGDDAFKDGPEPLSYGAFKTMTRKGRLQQVWHNALR